MAPREQRALLAPDDSEDEIIVSKRKLAQHLRRLEDLEKENQELRRELERLRPTLEKTQERNAELTDKAERLKRKLDTVQSSLPVLGSHGKTAAAVGVPSRRTFFKAHALLPRNGRGAEASPGTRGPPGPSPFPTILP